MSLVPKVKLNSGYEMPMVGLGTWHHGDQKEMTDALRFAIENGYRHIDGAHIYLNEKEVGEVYKDVINRGVVKREDLFLTTKLWNTFHHYDHVEEGFMNSLKKLGLEYVDMFYIHWASGFQYSDVNVPEDDEGRVIHTEDDYVDTWKAMEKLVKKGLVRSLGLCNFNSSQVKRIMDSCEIKPAALQVECNPRIQNEILRRFCEKHSIAMVAYSPFGSPDLPWGEKLPHILVDETLKSVAAKHGKSTAQVVLRFQLQRGVSTIPKSVFENELSDNLKIFDFKLDESDMFAIRKLDRNLRKIVPIKKLKDGSIEIRDKFSKFYPWGSDETEECLK